MGKCLYRVDYDHFQCYGPEEVIRKAKEIDDDFTKFSNNDKDNDLQDKAQEKQTYTLAPYKFIFKNCEHFARYCKVRRKYCNKLKDARQEALVCVGDTRTKSLNVLVAKTISRMMPKIGGSLIDEAFNVATQIANKTFCG